MRIELHGRAYAFGAIAGAPPAALLWPAPQDNVHFGYAVAISGKTAVVGKDSALQTVTVFS